MKAMYILSSSDPDVSDEMNREMIKLWHSLELGNDWCYVPGDNLLVDDYEVEDDERDYPHLLKYIKSKRLDPHEVLIHYWW